MRLAIERWGEPQFKPLAMLAQTIALSAESVHEAVKRSREQWLRATPEARTFSLVQWLRCYEKPLEVQSVLLQFLAGPSEIENLSDVRQAGPPFRRGLKREMETAATSVLMGKSSLTKRDVVRAHRQINAVYAAHLREVRLTVAGECEPPENFREWLGQPEFVWFFCVALPCFMKYRVWPWTLLTKAWQGEFEALRALLSLDPNVRSERWVAEALYRIERDQPEQAKLLEEARLAGESATPTLADIKFALAGLLYKWSRQMDDLACGELLFATLLRVARREYQRGVRLWIKRERNRRRRKGRGIALTAPAIRALFDAVAQDRDHTGVTRTDPDFCQSEETFRKRVKRNADLWADLWNWDKFRRAGGGVA